MKKKIEKKTGITAVKEKAEEVKTDLNTMDSKAYIIRHLKNRGLGILITDHNVRETLSIVDKAYIMANGKVLLSGSSKEIANSEEAKKIYLGENFKLD